MRLFFLGGVGIFVILQGVWVPVGRAGTDTGTFLQAAVAAGATPSTEPKTPVSGLGLRVWGLGLCLQGNVGV